MGEDPPYREQPFCALLFSRLDLCVCMPVLACGWKVGVLQVCVNGEAVLTLEPDNAPASSGMAASTTATAKVCAH
eukprot:55770-Eustigmatos_ZCMA.PRE.1